MGTGWNGLLQRRRRRQINATLRRVSRMDTISQSLRAERLLKRQLSRIDSASVEQKHDALVLHIGLAELYTAGGQPEKARAEHALCARLVGIEIGEPRPLDIYLFWLYLREGRWQRDEGQYELAAERFAVAAQVYRHAPQGTFNAKDAVTLFLDKSEAEVRQRLYIRAARTVEEATALVPEEKPEEKIDLLFRAARLAIQGKDHESSKEYLTRAASLYSGHPDLQAWAVEADILQGWSYRLQEQWKESRHVLLRAEQLLEDHAIQSPALSFRIAYGLAESVRWEEPQQAIQYYLAAGRAAFQKEDRSERSRDVAQSYLDAVDLAQEAGESPEQLLAVLTEAIDGLGGDDKADMPLGMLYSRRGVVRFGMGQYEEEYADYTEAIRCCRGAGNLQDQINLSGIYLNRAETAGRLYGMEAAEKDFQKAEDLLKSGSQLSPQLNFYFSRVYYEWGKQLEERRYTFPVLAEEKYQQALDCVEADLRGLGKGNPAVQKLYIYILERLGTVLYKSSRPSMARAWFQTALSGLRKLPDTDQKILIRSRLHQRQSECFAAENNVKEAFRELEQAILQREMLRGGGYPVDSLQAGDCLRAGQLCEELGQELQADEYYRKSIDLFEQNEKPSEKENLANAYYRLGNVQSALPEHVYTQVMHNYSRAIRLLEELAEEKDIDMAKACVVVYRTRGELYANMHEYELARADFERAAAWENKYLTFNRE